MTKRLIKIAKELNVGTGTIVEYLNNNGFDIENKPTAKVTDEMYSELLKEFQSSVAIKEKANQLVIGTNRAASSQRKENAPAPESSSEVSIQEPSDQESAHAEEEQAGKEKEEPTTESGEVEAEREKAEEPARPEAPQLNVKGKIDLSGRLHKHGKKEEPSSGEKEQPAPVDEPPKKDAEAKKEVETPASESPKEKQQEPPADQPSPETEAEPPADQQKEKPAPEEKSPKPAEEESREEKEKQETAEQKQVETQPETEPEKEEKEAVKEDKASSEETPAAPTPEEEAPKAEEKQPPKKVKKSETPKDKEQGKKETTADRQPEKEATSKPSRQTQPDKKKEEKPAAQEKEASSKPTAPEEEKEAKPTEETMRAKTPELRGLKILGKIDADKLKSNRNKRKKKDNKEKEGGAGANKDNRGKPKQTTGAESKRKGGEKQQQQQQQQQSQQQKRQQDEESQQARKKRRRKRRKVSVETNKSGGESRGGNRRGRGPSKQRRDEPQEVSKKEIEDKIKATMARISGSGKKKRQRLQRDKRERLREKQEVHQQEQETGKLQLTEFVTVQELANLMDVSATDVITTCMNLGVIVSINQRLDAEIIELVAEEYDHEVEFISAEEIAEEEEEIVDDPEDLQPRAPIVTVMGHVDHGKTSLLDYVRKANVVSGEAGGITQHIGAYEVKAGENRRGITFLDTPGHEAFTAMRARGAKITDIAVVIIAADDSIMPQTKEAISHAQAAGVPIVFAINKVDKPDAQPERIKQELANMNLLVEEWGGQYQSQDISAKTGAGIDELLEKILLEAEVLELQANPDREAIGTVLEASLDRGRGYVSKLLVQTGTLQIGDAVVSGDHSGKIKAMFNERNQRVEEAGPSQPVLVLGLSGAPTAGERFKVLESETEARQIASRRAQISREQANRATKRISLDEIGRRLALGNFQELNLIVKGDVDGSVEALSDSLIKQSIETVQVNVIHKAVGQIVESDVLLASASDAVIIGFQVRPSLGARKLAEKEGVEIKTYSIIYEAIEEVRAAIEGMLEPTKEERVVGQVEVRETYKISKVGTVAGCYVQEGRLDRNTHVRLIRNGIVVYPTKEGAHGEIASLKRYKDDVKEVKAGLECGISIKNFNDIKVGDIIEGYEIVEIKQTLD